MVSPKGPGRLLTVALGSHLTCPLFQFQNLQIVWVAVWNNEIIPLHKTLCKWSLRRNFFFFFFDWPAGTSWHRPAWKNYNADHIRVVCLINYNDIYFVHQDKWADWSFGCLAQFFFEKNPSTKPKIWPQMPFVLRCCRRCALQGGGDKLEGVTSIRDWQVRGWGWHLWGEWQVKGGWHFPGGWHIRWGVTFTQGGNIFDL